MSQTDLRTIPVAGQSMVASWPVAHVLLILGYEYIEVVDLYLTTLLWNFPSIAGGGVVVSERQKNEGVSRLG